jgi:MFS transporter, ACS family, D-galactonate transporter
MSSLSPSLNTGTAPGSEASPEGKRWLVVGLLFSGVLINYVDRGNLSIAAVPIMHELRVSTAAIGVTLSAFFWTYLIFQIPAGYFVDRTGLKWSYGIAFLIWTISSAAIALVHSLSALILLRLLLGMSEAVAAPASLAYIKRNFRGEEQGLPTAIFLSGMMLGPAAGALLGGVLLERFGWRALFLFTGLVGILWLWPWLHWAPGGAKQIDHPAIRNTASEVNPMHVLGKLLLNPISWGIGLSAVFYGYFWYFCLTWLPSYLIMSRAFTYTKMGAFMALPLVAMAVSCIVFGRLADRLAWTDAPLRIRKRFVMVGFLMASSIVLITVAQSSAEVLAILLFCFTAIGFAGANYWVITELVSPARLVGRFVGGQNAVAQLGGVSAPIITGLLLGNGHDFRRSFCLAAICLPLSAGAILLLIREGAVRQLDSLLTARTCRKG